MPEAKRTSRAGAGDSSLYWHRLSNTYTTTSHSHCRLIRPTAAMFENDLHSTRETLAGISSLIPSAFYSGLGSWLVGSFISTLLEGILLLQTFRYFRLYPKDPPYLQIWVGITVALQTVSVALAIHTCYFYMVSNYFNPGVLLSGVVVSATATTVIGPVNILLVEMFFVRRVYMVGEQYRKFAILPTLLVLGGVGSYFALTAEAFAIKNLTQDVAAGQWGGGAITASSLLLAADIQLTGVLIYALHTSRTGIQRTSSMINLLILYTISSGLLICIFNIGSVTLSTVMPHNVVFTVFLIVGQQVYSNSLVTALISRRFIQKHGDMSSSDLSPYRSPPVRSGPSTGTMVSGLELGSMAFARGTTTTSSKDVVTTGSVAALQFGVDSRPRLSDTAERDMHNLSKDSYLV
ncbi:hypothetical protein BD309DRAFT_1078604 [Dichomitus squalens]|nr:hypothetical protein BD309DRAFT_1078604 [Dichomitus squalens]